MPQPLYEAVSGKVTADPLEIDKQLLEIIEIFVRNPAHATATATADITVNIDMVNNFTNDIGLI